MIADELFSLKNKVAIVTGGARGLGLAVSEALATAGSHIILCSRKIETCDQQAKNIRRLGVQCIALKCDVTIPENVENLAKFALSEFGHVDILVNNAGATWGASVLDYPLEEWNRVINVNVTGLFLCTQAIGRIMIEQKKGKVINVSSVMGTSGSDPSYMDAIAYNTSKGAIIAFTKDLAVKWAPHNINVNAIAPGFIPTDMTKGTIEKHQDKIMAHIPFGRLGKREDLKGSIIFLSSAASDYVTGHVLFVDGGWHAM
jgi:gluconate 5-dehydrogenase